MVLRWSGDHLHDATAHPASTATAITTTTIPKPTINPLKNKSSSSTTTSSLTRCQPYADPMGFAAAAPFDYFGTVYTAGASIDTTGWSTRDVVQLMRRCPVYYLPAGLDPNFDLVDNHDGTATITT